MEHTVSSIEVKSYLQQKIIKLKHELEVIEKALLMLEEAEMEVASNKLIEEARQITYNGVAYKVKTEGFSEVIEQVEPTNGFVNKDELVEPLVSVEAKSAPVDEVICSELPHLKDFKGKQLPPVSFDILSYKFKSEMSAEEFLIDSRKIRLYFNLSASKIATELNMSKSSLYFIEDGKYKGRKSTILGLAKIYGINIIDIDQRYGTQENGKYKLAHKGGYVKKGRAKQIKEISTNGEVVKHIYKKRESKTKAAPEDA